MKMINLALAEIKPAYYPGEEKLVSLDMLKLYQGEDVFWQNLEDLDPDRWLDEGELTKLPEIPRYETEAETRDQPEDQGRQELPSEPTQDIPMIVEDQEVIAEREGVHERIQAEIQQGDKEAERQRGQKK